MFRGLTAFAHPEHIDLLVQEFEELEEWPQAITSLNPIDWQKRNAAFEMTQAGRSWWGSDSGFTGIFVWVFFVDMSELKHEDGNGSLASFLRAVFSS